MTDVHALVKEVLAKGYLLSLATVDEGGVWVADVIYVTDDNFTLYWLSQTNTRHSKALLKNPRVAGTVTISNNPGESNVGVQIEGDAEKINGDILEIAIKHRLKRGKPAPQKAGEILDPGESWYCLKPKKIELTYEPLLGFNKEKLEF